MGRGPQQPPPWRRENGVDEWISGIRTRLVSSKPQAINSKAAVVAALWPDIETALREGQTLRAVSALLVEEGLQISYGCLASYLSRLRARSVILSGKAASQPRSMSASPEKEPADDPFAKVRQRMRKPSGFDYPPGVEEEKLI